MSRKAKRCTIGFERICPMEWDLLDPTDDGKKRHCVRCDLDVYWCDSEVEALWHGVRGHCIALQWDSRDFGEPRVPVAYLGKPAYPRVP